MEVVTTIVTKSHVSWALALNESLLKFDDDISVYILITDVDTFSSHFAADFPNIKFVFLKDLLDIQFCKELIEKYKDTPDYLRWSLKPILINYLFSIDYQKVMFCDCDIYFFNKFNFIWDELDHANVLLTPHWFDHNLPHNVHTLHTTGIINGGFIAVSNFGIPAMNWWAKMCLDKCNSQYGTINVDQGYLEMMPFYFDGVKILKHKGLNVSYWSNDHLIRISKDDNFFIFDGSEMFPLIFYHFAANKYLQFYETEKTFYPILVILNNALSKYGYSKNIIEIGKLQASGKHIPLRQRIRNKLVMAIPYRFYKIK
jgi:hypothetical protein